MTRSAEPRVLQFCHGYDGPFLDCARQYASLFAGTPYKVTTVFLTGRSDPEVAARCASDEVLFLEYGSRDIRGLKLKAIRDLREIARSRDFRFCIAHRFKPIWIASLATRLPIVGVHHAFGDYQRLSRKVFAGLMSKRLSLLAVSDAVRDDIRRCLPKWPAERIETLYNRIDVAALQAEQVERLSARRQLRLPDEAWVVGNVGRLHPDKDQATLLRGFAAAPAAEQPAGDPRQRPPGRAAQGPGLRTGYRRARAVPRPGRRGTALLQGVRRLRLSSDHEPFGMVLLEAMVAGVPLIATACGGAREVVEGVGILFPLGDEAALAEGLTHLAALDRRQREACARLMLERLETRFSDAAVRREFWRLPTIAGFASESAC